jgi:hypothetical protein
VSVVGVEEVPWESEREVPVPTLTAYISFYPNRTRVPLQYRAEDLNFPRLLHLTVFSSMNYLQNSCSELLGE